MAKRQRRMDGMGGAGLRLGDAVSAEPFVNPNQRGVELPAGCKDLMDVLKMDGGGGSTAYSLRMERGKLREVPERVATLCRSKAFLKGLTVSHPRWNFVVQAV